MPGKQRKRSFFFFFFFFNDCRTAQAQANFSQALEEERVGLDRLQNGYVERQFSHGVCTASVFIDHVRFDKNLSSFRDGRVTTPSI